MNRGGLVNRGGEILKELDELLDEIAPLRKIQATAKFNFEDVQTRMNNLQSVLYNEFTTDPEVDWENQNPILDTDGKPMAEFEAQYRTMMISAMMQTNVQFMALSTDQDKLKEAYYTVETDVITLMERIGALKASAGLIAALARLADES